MSSGTENGPGRLLVFFLLLHVLNQVDRNLISSFGPEIVTELQLSNTQFGIVAGIAFTAVYALLALGAGVLADRYGRARVMGSGLAIWSACTALSGLATRFAMLVAVRPFVAAGEATLIPTATAIIAERFSEARRATAIGVFFVGVPLGIGVSFLMAGWLGPILGWRGVFLLLGALGLGLVPLVLRLAASGPEMPETQASVPPSGRDVLRDLFREVRQNADMRLCLLGSVLMHVTLAGMPFVKLWLAKSEGPDVARIGVIYGAIVILFGIAGAIFGGSLADRWGPRLPGGRPTLLAVLILVLAPFIIAFRFAPLGSPLFYMGMAAGVLFFSSFYGPAFAILQSVTPGHLRASVTGLSMLLVNVVALGLGSLVIGAAGDALAAQGVSNPLTLPLLTADCLSLLTMFCFALIGWRAARREGLNKAAVAR